jgi:hypothetical protein
LLRLTGPIFRPIAKGERLQNARLTDRSVAKIVKAHAARAGLDPEKFAGHSLRSGFLTSAAAHGASIFKMADQSRHKSLETLRGYVRDAEYSKTMQERDCFRKAEQCSSITQWGEAPHLSSTSLKAGIRSRRRGFSDEGTRDGDRE